MLLVKGERFDLSQNNLLRFQSIIEWDCGDCEIESTIFLLKDNKASDENVIFFNNPIAIGHSIVLESRNNITSIDFNLSLIPNEIDKIVITLTLDSTQNLLKPINICLKKNKLEALKSWVLVAIIMVF